MKTRPVIDNLIIEYPAVTHDKWKRINQLLDYLEMNGLVVKVHRMIGKGASEYHYQVLIGEQGGGRISLQWKHNSAREDKPYYSARLEVNPQKINKQHEQALHMIQSEIGSLEMCLLRGMDIAWDIPVMKENVIVIPKTGREENRVKGTRYYGYRGKDGYLKIYDKKKELEEVQGCKVDLEHLTRIEYHYKNDIGIPLSELDNKLDIQPSKFYDVVLIGGIGSQVKAEIKACIMCYINGWTQLKDYTRTTRQHIKEALEASRRLKMNETIKDYKQELITVIKRIGYDLYYATEKVS